MEIEKLNLTQLVLLVLLVSFVTSIATGIVTVKLLAEAPPAVTQTVNRIVERTVETVLPENNGTVITKETTVVVKEDDLITDSIAGSLSKTARIYEGTSTTTPVVGLASLIGTATFVTDSSVVNKDHLIQLGNTLAVFTVSERYPSVGLAVLTPKATSTGFTNSYKVANVDSLKLGQTVVSVLSVVSERVHIGAVASKSYLTDVKRADSGSVSVRSIESTVDEALVPGAPLINVFGDLVGISTAASGAKSFISASDISQILAPQRATSTPATLN